MAASYKIKLEMDDDEYAAKVKEVERKLSEAATKAEQANAKQAASIKQIDAARKAEIETEKKAQENQFQALPKQEKLNQLTKRQVELQKELNSALKNGTEQRQKATQAALKDTDNQIQAVQTGDATGGKKTGLKKALGVIGSGVGGLLTGGGYGAAGGLAGAVAGSFFGPEGTVIGGTVGGALGSFAGMYKGKIDAQVAEYQNLARTIANGAAMLQTSTENYQQMEYAANKVGASITDVGTAYKTLLNTQGAALRGQREQIDAFAALGITLDKLRDSTPETLFNQLSELGSKNLNITQQAAMLKLLGESAFNLAPAFRKGFAAARAEASATGAIINSSVIAALDEAARRAERNGLRMKAMFAPVALEAAKFSERFSDMSANLLTAGKQFFGELSQQNGFTGILKNLFLNPQALTQSFDKAKALFDEQQKKSALERAKFDEQLFKQEQLAKIEKQLQVENNWGRRIGLNDEADRLRKELGIMKEKAQADVVARAQFEGDALQRVGGYLGSVPVSPLSPATKRALGATPFPENEINQALASLMGGMGMPFSPMSFTPPKQFTMEELQPYINQVQMQLTEIARSLNGIKANTQTLPEITQ